MKNFCVFQDNDFSQETQKDMIKIMEEINFGPNETIIKEGDLENQAMYLLVDGNVEIFKTLNDKFIEETFK